MTEDRPRSSFSERGVYEEGEEIEGMEGWEDEGKGVLRFILQQILRSPFDRHLKNQGRAEFDSQKQD